MNMVELLLELGADPSGVEETTIHYVRTDEVDFETAMRLIEDAKLKREKSSTRLIPVEASNAGGKKRQFSEISD